MAEQLANNASTTLDGAINSSTTSVVVIDGSVFPSSGDFRILLGSEIMLVTARSTNTLTVTRGHEGTTPASHNDGATVEHVLTKGSVEQILADFDQSGVYASRPASPRKGTIYTATDYHARWWYDGTNWSLINPTYVPHARRWDSSAWTAQNHSTATFTDRNGILDVTTMPTSSSAIRGYSKSLPSTPYKCTWILSHNVYARSSASWYVGHRENSTGKLKVMYSASNSPQGASGVEAWTTFNLFSSTSSTGRTVARSRVTWARVENDGTNLYYYTSFDGKNYSLLFSEAKTVFWTTAADQIFFGAFTGVAYATGHTPNMTLLGYWEE